MQRVEQKEKMIPEEIKKILEKYNIKCEVIQHELSGKTTDDAEKALGVSRKYIIKSLLLENRAIEYVGVIIPGDKRLDFHKLKEILYKEKKFKDSKFSLSKPDKVQGVLKYKVGGVPPFVFYLRKIPTYVDSSLLEKEFVIGAGGDEYTGIKFDPKNFNKIDYRYGDITE